MKLAFLNCYKSSFGDLANSFTKVVFVCEDNLAENISQYHKLEATEFIFCNNPNSIEK